MTSNNIRQEIEDLLNCVTDQLFRICWCGDPWYQMTGNTLHLTDNGTRDYIQQIALHEATHMLLKRGGHDVEFWKRFESLVLKHLDTVLNEHQIKMKKDYLNWIYTARDAISYGE